MTDRPSENSRRRFIKLTAIGLAAAPFANALLLEAAKAADTVNETDPQATALGYKHDAATADKRKDTSATCGNCSFYSSAAGEAHGPCALFQGKLVAASGWCTAWAKKAA